MVDWIETDDAPDGPDERRLSARASLPATAVLFVGGSEIGRYAVDDLSTGGARLTGAVGVPRGQNVQLLLHVAGRDPVELGARVIRRQDRRSSDATMGLCFEPDSAWAEDALRAALLDGPVDMPRERLDELWDADDPGIVALVPPPPD